MALGCNRESAWRCGCAIEDGIGVLSHAAGDDARPIAGLGADSEPTMRDEGGGELPGTVDQNKAFLALLARNSCVGKKGRHLLASPPNPQGPPWTLSPSIDGSPS